MIWIKTRVQFNVEIKTSVLRFDNYHEKNFKVLYEIVDSQVEKQIEINLEQLLIYCSYPVVNQIRQYSESEDVVKGFSKKLLNARPLYQKFSDIEKIEFDLIVDSLPKRTFAVVPPQMKNSITV